MRAGAVSRLAPLIEAHPPGSGYVSDITEDTR
jgi:hypothetical protein